MASGHPGDAARQIHRLFRDGTAGALTDGQLLKRFATRRPEAAEAAFEALVGRHGPMVLRVCRGVLRDPHDVDDAFQATFLVLVKKAHAIGERELLGPWLYGVARRVARKARGVAAKRNKREGGIVDDPPADVAEGPWLDLRPILHEELDRLPEKYRKPVVLCHLQGLTHSEAAAELAWPVGTVSVRLSRARKLLKDRLTRRGLTVTAPLWAAGLTLEGASASVPESLIRSTAKAALEASAGKMTAAGAIAAGAASLTKRTLTMMLASRLKWFVVPLALGLGATGGVVANRQLMERSIEARERARAAEVAATRAPKPPAAGPSEPGRSPFDVSTVQGQPPSRTPEGPHPVARDSQVELNPPPGYFDVAPLATKDESGPAPVKPGQTLIVEVLEALPGRPITGERVVRPDGTISLGFYGDLPVAGLNRNQIKVKLLQHLYKYMNAEVLGLQVYSASEKALKAVPPIGSNRVYVDDTIYPSRSAANVEDSINAYRKYYEKRQQAAATPTPSVGIPTGADVDDPRVARLGARIDELNRKLEGVLKELEQLRRERGPAKP